MTLWYIVDRDTRKVVDVFNYPAGKGPAYKPGTWTKARHFYKTQNGYDTVAIMNKASI